MATLQGPSKSWQLKVYPIFTLLGWVLIGLSLSIGIFVLTSTAIDYWGGNAKAARDTAEVGSALLGQLNTLTVIPRWLTPLTFLGTASFMVGIALEFSAIPNILKNRGQVMSICFPQIVQNPAD